MKTPMGTVLFLAVALTGAAHAQDHGAFGRLDPGQPVRVKTVGGSRFSTRLGGGHTDSLRFAHALIPFQPDRVDSLWVRGRATVTGMIVGAAIVAPVTFGLFAWVCEALSEGSGCDEYDKVTLLAAGGGAAGALVGAGIGSLIPKWRLRYARNREIAVGPAIGPGRLGIQIGL